MSGLPRSDDRLAEWLHAEAAASPPPGLVGEIRARTSRRRPRPRWLASVHALGASEGLVITQGATRRLVWTAAVLAITLIALVGVIVGSERLVEHRVITTIAPDHLLEREVHQAVRLDDGRVLIFGGANASGIENRAALVDPWSGEVRAVPMSEGRLGGAAVAKLDDGDVLIAGGYTSTAAGDENQTTSAEIFDPVTASFSRTDDLTHARGIAFVLKSFVPTTVRLPDGRVVVVGGTTEQMRGRAYPRPAEVFDPVTATFAEAAPLPCVGPSSDGSFGQEVRTADLLPDGRILLSCERWGDRRSPVRGGRTSRATDPQDDAVVPEQRFFAFDPETGTAEPVDVGAPLVARTSRLSDGSLLLWVGSGTDRLANGDRSERYRLARLELPTFTFRDLGIEVTRSAAVELLDSGHVLIVGGRRPETGEPTDEVHLLDPCSGDLTPAATLGTTWLGGTVTQLDERHLLLVGGQLGTDPDMWDPVPATIVTIEAPPPLACRT
jgi:hypothetical protein